MLNSRSSECGSSLSCQNQPGRIDMSISAGAKTRPFEYRMFGIVPISRFVLYM